ncbi:MAG: sigma-70 family RNA polymerase sigma factor [Planctomycetota bacterium]
MVFAADNSAARDAASKRESLDAQVLARALEDHLPAITAFLRLRAGGRMRKYESISDLAQSVCREVLTDLADLPAPSVDELRVWLYKAAERKLFDKHRYWRAAKRDPQRVQALSPDITAENCVFQDRGAAAWRSPSAIVGREEDLSRFENAYSRLSLEHREVLLLARILGLAHADIARLMGRSESAARMLLTRALSQLTRFC